VAQALTAVAPVRLSRQQLAHLVHLRFPVGIQNAVPITGDLLGNLIGVSRNSPLHSVFVE